MSRHAPHSVTSPPLPPLPPPTPLLETSKQAYSTTGPAYPTGWEHGPTGERGRTTQHARRPSRAERYEVLVDSARQLLQRASNQGHVGLGIDSEMQGPVDSDEWRGAVGNLLKVVDGMARQLATHDELSAQLKIAQSNLTLAETHSEFLEETLRRRDSRSSASMVSRHSTSGTPALPPTNGTTRRSTAETTERPESSASLFGIGFEDGRNSAASFFRMPSKRKPTPSTVSNASSVSLPPPTAPHTLRSSSSSPRLGDHIQKSRTSISSLDEQHSPREIAGKSVAQLTTELFAMQSQVTSLEQASTTLRSTNTSLRRSADVMAGRCAELEKTKDDLMSELENLSVELFQEANTMVADERKKSAKAEEEVTRLRTEIEALSRDLELLRRTGLNANANDDGRRNSGASSRTMLPRRPTATNGLPTLSPPDPSTTSNSTTTSPALASINTAVSPAISQTASPDPDSVSLTSATSSSRKWFNFGRAKPDRSSSMGEEGASPNMNVEDSEGGGHLQPPSMSRAPSGGSVRSISSISSSFFSAMSADDEARRDAEEGHGEREELLDDREGEGEGDEGFEQDPQTPLVAANSRGRIPSLPKASLYPLPPSPNPSHPPPPTLSINTASPLRPTAPPAGASPRIKPPSASSFSPVSSPPSSPRIPFPSSSPPILSSSRTPRVPGSLDTIRGRPIAIHSFEGEAIAKSPKSPNAMRWSELAGVIPSPSVSASSTPAVSPPTATAAGESNRSLSAAGRRIEPTTVGPVEASRSRSPLLPSSERDSVKEEPAPVERESTRPAGHRPPPLKLDTSATSPLSRPGAPPSSSAAASALPPSGTAGTRSTSPPTSQPSFSRSNSSTQRPTFIRSTSSRSGASLHSISTRGGLPSPTFTLPASSSGLISTSTSLSSLRSPGAAVDDLEGLMRNIEDMNRSLFGDEEEEEGDGEAEGLGQGEVEEAKRRE